MRNKNVSVGDLVRISSLPRKKSGANIWKPELDSACFGIVIEEDPRSEFQILVGQCVTVKLNTGEIVTLSSNMLEIIKKGVPENG